MLRALLLIFTIAPIVVWSQTCAPPAGAPIVAYPAGTFIDGVGTSDIPVTSSSEPCKKHVRQGFALIHCFWFNEAVRSFRDAVKEDPSCAIAWCGLNVAETMPWNKRSEYAQEAKYAIDQAVRRWESASPLEQRLITTFKNRDVTTDDRRSPFNNEMHKIVDDYPEAFEPRLILAGVRIQLCMADRTLPSGVVQNELVEAARLIEPILAKDPLNPGALHYHIHAYEGSRPEKALSSARLLGQVAPASPHMVHMSGHIYNVLGMWDEANKAFERSAAIGEEYASKVGAKPSDADWNYGHNRDYRGVNYAEQGRVKDAFVQCAYSGRKTALLWRVSAWKRLAEAVKNQTGGGETAYYQGMSAAMLGNFDEAKGALKRLLDTDGSSWGTVAKRVLETEKLELKGLVECKAGHFEEGLAGLRKAVEEFGLIEYEEPPYYFRPPQETMGDMLIEAGRPMEAVEVFKDALKVKRNSGVLYFGIARALEAAQETDKARAGYEKFLTVWSKADEDLDQIVHAKRFLASTRRG